MCKQAVMDEVLRSFLLHQSIRVLITMFKYLCFVQKYFHQNKPKVPEVKVLNHCMIIIIFIIII